MASSRGDDWELKLAEIQGQHRFVADLMTGALDNLAMDVLGLATPESVPRIVDYMKRDEDQDA